MREIKFRAWDKEQIPSGAEEQRATMSELERYIISRVNTRLESEIQPLISQGEWFVVKRYFGVGVPRQTLKQIAQLMEVTPSRVGQIKGEAVRKLRATWTLDLSHRQDTIDSLRAASSYYHAEPCKEGK